MFRGVTEHLDYGDVRQFIRLAEDSPDDYSSPNVLAVLVDKYVFFVLDKFMSWSCLGEFPYLVFSAFEDY